MITAPKATTATGADRSDSQPNAAGTWHDRPDRPSAQHLQPAHWLRARGLNIERQLFVVQWALPLVLTGIVFAYETGEHLIRKGQPYSSVDFLGEVFFFGILGPVAVWLVLWWIRGEWHERERDKQALQHMYDELSEAQERLNTLHAQRGDLLNRLMSVQEEERRRLAREIHDELGQLLTGLSLNLRLCREAVPGDLAMAHDRLARASSVVRHTIEQSHRLITDLRPTVLDDYGLVPALQEEVSQRLTPLGIEAELDTEGDVERLPANVATAAFRIVQEAITNIIRHARARRVQIRLQQAAEALTVTVEDDGVGLPAGGSRNLDGRPALGILGMQERARALGGWLEVTPRGPRGTRVHLWLPLPREG